MFMTKGAERSSLGYAPWIKVEKWQINMYRHTAIDENLILYTIYTSFGNYIWIEI